jgi:hypothetical protein
LKKNQFFFKNQVFESIFLKNKKTMVGTYCTNMVNGLTGANDFFLKKPFVCVQIMFFRSKNAKNCPPKKP